MSITASDNATRPLVSCEFQSRAQLENPPAGADLLVMSDHSNSHYIVAFAVSPEALRRAQRLRYEVFNEELGEGLESSRESGLDRDEYDAQMHHIVLIEVATNMAIGTYRIQTVSHALKHAGIYSEREYDLTALQPYFPELIECGRACIADGHRTFSNVIMLWKAIGTYLQMYEKRYLFGCCSLTTTDPKEGWRALRTLRGENVLHAELFLPAREPYSCGDPSTEFNADLGPGGKIPKLFSAYLHLGCQVISGPAIDMEFSTVDFLVMLDSERVSFSTLALK